MLKQLGYLIDLFRRAGPEMVNEFYRKVICGGSHYPAMGSNGFIALALCRLLRLYGLLEFCLVSVFNLLQAPCRFGILSRAGFMLTRKFFPLRKFGF